MDGSMVASLVAKKASELVACWAVSKDLKKVASMGGTKAELTVVCSVDLKVGLSAALSGFPMVDC